MRVVMLACIALVSGLAGAGACAADDDITVYRCVDGKGHVSLQDDPCPPGSQQTARDMLRPKDAPPALLVRPLVAEAKPVPKPEPTPRVQVPPPPLYRCTSYDGIVRDSEVYDPNPRCEPLALYFPDAKHLTAQQAGACRWVQDSCVRLSDSAACARYEAKRRDADEAARFAFSDTMAYHRSELERLTQIVEDSCQ